MLTQARRPGRPEKYNNEVILAAALDLYWKFGFNSLSINELAKHAGFPKPSLYRHFKNEDMLQAQVIQAYGEDIAKRVHDIFSTPQSFIEKAMGFVDLNEHSMSVSDNGCLLFYSRSQIDLLGPLAKSSCEQSYAYFLDKAKAYIEQAVTKGEIVLKMELMHTAFLFLESVNVMRNALHSNISMQEAKRLCTAHIHNLFIIKTDVSTVSS
jgi:AcrR family transcriptional regulator